MQVKSELVSSLMKQLGQRLLISRAAIHLSSFNQLKKIEKTQDPKTNTTIVEGKYIETDKLSRSKVINFNSNTSDPLRPCAFCELEKRNIYVQHTDILILRQFLRDDGVPLPRKVTGLCKTQNKKLNVLARQARIAGLTLNLQPNLLDGTKPSADPRKRPEYLKWNHYFDDYETLKKNSKYL